MATEPIRAGGAQESAAGRRAAELFEEHGRMVYGLCRALLRDPDDADDATQSVFIAAYTSLLRGCLVREQAGWLATIARNECASRAKARMREPVPLFESDLAHAPGPETELDRKNTIAELRVSIAALPEKQREAVVLRDLYGLQYAEVGAALGISVASVESLLFRARRTLRGSLKPLAGGALTVPVAVREGIARALPDFTTGVPAGGAAGTGGLGLGLLAKFAGGPVAVKATAGIAAAVAAGSVAMIGVGNGDRQPSASEAAPPVTTPRFHPGAGSRADLAELTVGAGAPSGGGDTAGTSGAPDVSVSAGSSGGDESERGPAAADNESRAGGGHAAEDDYPATESEDSESSEDRYPSGSGVSSSGPDSEEPDESESPGPLENDTLEAEPGEGEARPAEISGHDEKEDGGSDEEAPAAPA